MRQLLAVLVAAGAAALGGGILGEYDLARWWALLAAVVFAAVVAELVLLAAGRPLGQPVVLAVAAAVAAGAGMALAVWIATNHGRNGVPVSAAASVVVAGAVAGAWVARAGATPPSQAVAGGAHAPQHGRADEAHEGADDDLPGPQREGQ